MSVVLIETPERLELQETDTKSGPVFVDFTAGALDYRRRHGGAQMILKAIGGAGQKVLDMTAGLGRDAFILASLGCRVTSIEKSPVLHALLIDGVKRAKENKDVAPILEKLEFCLGDAHEWLNKKSFSYDVAYMDPMFPHKKKSALPKKEMRLLQKLLGSPVDESESKELLSQARNIARRVVVKRPLHASELEKGVTVSFKGESTRFDVYVRS
jgi:16S rRNA (guanine1516-N2)-methyltransferase